MADQIDNLVVGNLKRIQAEQTASRERDRDIVSRLSGIEAMVARIARDGAYVYSEQVADRHALDTLKERVARIERRLELEG